MYHKTVLIGTLMSWIKWVYWSTK